MTFDDIYHTIEVFEGYKTYKGFKYHLNFPNEWILFEAEGTGRQCGNCVDMHAGYGYATWRGIILGYCANCALTYEGERGVGFHSCGIEIRYPDTPACAVTAFDTYLKNVDLETVGDIEDNPEDTMYNRMVQMYEFPIQN